MVFTSDYFSGVYNRSSDGITFKKLYFACQVLLHHCKGSNDWHWIVNAAASNYYLKELGRYWCTGVEYWVLLFKL